MEIFNPPVVFNSVIPMTMISPIIKNNMFLYLPFISFFSVLITIGIANIINPRNRELNLYISLWNKLDNTLAARRNPITQPIPILIK